MEGSVVYTKSAGGSDFSATVSDSFAVFVLLFVVVAFFGADFFALACFVLELAPPFFFADFLFLVGFSSSDPSSKSSSSSLSSATSDSTLSSSRPSHSYLSTVRGFLACAVAFSADGPPACSLPFDVPSCDSGCCACVLRFLLPLGDDDAVFGVCKADRDGVVEGVTSVDESRTVIACSSSVVLLSTRALCHSCSSWSSSDVSNAYDRTVVRFLLGLSIVRYFPDIF
mmetsp:Transcript_3061/g.4686  ORF Transcript_3061/g.4686 Transcript_3061/m.4686 type:complete len:227 (-) Transcript_3061:35-715(-)